MRFRDDIAGLRAVAIIPIVLLHAGVSAIPGGFVGVDVFYVISGFLITGIIHRELDRGSFSLAAFYRRRAVRILPALLVMLVATLAAGCFFMFPAQLRELAQSVAAAAAFGSNIFYWRLTGYFEPSTDLKPLLHTWSLGVEEQFYLFYPVLLLAITRFARHHTRLVIAIIVALSFGCSLYFSVKGPAGAFYLLPTRAWELGLGALVALRAFPTRVPRWTGNLLAILGLALVVTGLFVITAASLFPAPWGLLPALGTALLIAYGENAPTARVLRVAPMRWIGTISYSLYLWHWPILTFWRLEHGRVLGAPEIVGTIAAALVVATLSYLLVERPVMRRYRAGPSKPILVAAAGAIILVAGAALAVAATPTHWRRLTPAVARVASFVGYENSPALAYQFRAGSCFTDTGQARSFDAARCLAMAPDRPNILLVGDSLGAHIWRALAERHPDVNLMQATFAGCQPDLDPNGEAKCSEAMRRVLQGALRDRKVSRLVLAAQWHPENLARVERLVRAFVKAGIPVTMVGPPAQYGDDFPPLLARAIERNDRRIVDDSRLMAAARLDRVMATTMTAAGADYRSIQSAECPAGVCTLMAPNGAPLLFDNVHLTLDGARLVIAREPIF